MGKALRDKCPRASHAEWKPPGNRPDPVRVVLETDKGRIPDLVPLRHGRMVLSPFTFYRGSAFTMAQDLAGTPSSGLRVQCGGDSHLVNFRGLATAERQVIFALNDLDETLPAPWEWDLKRLAASIVVACRDNGLSESTAKDTVLGCVRSYRERMAEFAEMKVLDLWYFSIEANMLIAGIKDSALRHRAIKGLAKARDAYGIRSDPSADVHRHTPKPKKSTSRAVVGLLVSTDIHTLSGQTGGHTFDTSATGLPPHRILATVRIRHLSPCNGEAGEPLIS